MKAKKKKSRLRSLKKEKECGHDLLVVFFQHFFNVNCFHKKAPW